MTGISRKKSLLRLDQLAGFKIRQFTEDIFIATLVDPRGSEILHMRIAETSSNVNVKTPSTFAKFYDRYLERLTTWFGDRVSDMDDFDLICKCELDFIEMLLLGEQEFAINLLESPQQRTDFYKVEDFLRWAATKSDAIN